MDPAQEQRIKDIFEGFLQRRIKRLRRLKLDDLDINPFLLRVISHEMGLDNAQSIVRWLVNQRLERGTVTSFGATLEKVAQVFGESTGVEGADIMLTRGGRHYYIQVKSGPNTVPKDLAARTSELLQSAQRRNRGSIALFGMCYGNPGRVSNIVRRYVGVDYLIGREFWEFISGESGCIDRIYEIAHSVSRHFRDSTGHSMQQILEEKITELTAAFRDRYGDSGTEMWEKLLERNS